MKSVGFFIAVDKWIYSKNTINSYFYHLRHRSVCHVVAMQNISLSSMAEVRKLHGLPTNFAIIFPIYERNPNIYQGFDDPGAQSFR